MSLGVDLVPKKVCSLNCVYCEVGRTTNLTLMRDEYVPFDEVKEELVHYFKNNPDPDYVTFSGSGEPTLNSRIGDVIEFIKDIRPDLPVAVLTNGTLFYDKGVRNSLLKADLVLPSLDAASEEIFKKMNRPHRDLNVQMHIEGLILFRQEFLNSIWLEVFILPGYNDNTEELTRLKEIIKKINPDEVQINTLDRPGTVEGLRGADYNELKNILNIFNMENVRIISSILEAQNRVSYRKDIESTIFETIKRRPCTVEDLIKILNIPENELKKYLAILLNANKVETVIQHRGVFYKTKEQVSYPKFIKTWGNWSKNIKFS
ncbi:radical SAM protein [Desulfothermus okinawensis JCM 13304]